MLQDIAPHRFRCEYQPREPGGQDLLLCFRGDTLLFEGEGLPPAGRATGALRYLFSVDGTGFFLGEAPGEDYRPVGVLRELRPQWLAFAAVTGHHLAGWYRGNKYCGACRAELEHKSDERALVCPDCGRIIYPTIAPAVIVAVLDGDRAVVTRYQGRPTGRYALVAGFCEIGETPEDTVRREVLEETGLTVEDVRYFGAQPWGFSGSLLLGYTARLAGEDRITVQESELAEARWITRAEIPESDPRVSLTATMMEAFRTGKI